MTDPATDPTTDPTPDRPLDRRLLLRGGAVLAGAAGATAVAAVMAPSAQAADGGSVVIGATNAASSTTTLTIGGTAGSTAPTLALNNAKGAQLFLQPLDVDFDGDLKVGELANSTLGPYIGLTDGDETFNSYLVTAYELPEIQPAPIPTAPERLLDTRTSAGRANIVAMSSGALDASNQLKAGAYLDIAVAEVDDNISGVFLNLAAVKPTANGYLTAYPPAPKKPDPSSLNYQKGITISNGGFFGLAISGGMRAIRITVSATSHVVVDFTGYVYGGVDFSTAAAKGSRRALARRRSKQLKQARGFRPVQR